jgi:HK97 family phage prohead protease
MSDLRTIELGSVAIRAEGEADGRTITGYAVRWGELTDPGATAENGGLAEGFLAGAFADAIASRGGRPWPYLDQHRGRVVGSVKFTEDAVGLRFDGRLLDSQAARDYAESVPAGADGVSLEFVFTGAKSIRKGGAVLHQAIRRIAALAGVYAPAYTGATVAIRAHDGGEPVDDETTTETAPAVREAQAGTVSMTPEAIRSLATDAATEIMRRYVERGALVTSTPDPLAEYASLGALVRAAGRAGASPEVRAYAARAIASRALDDTTFNSGANAALANGNLVSQDIHRLVNNGRPAITAFGGPRSLGDTAGLTLGFPYFDGTLSDFVAAQSAEKAAITSASVDIKLATEALVTYAGGSDISYQVIRRGEPSILEAYARIWLAAWSAVTDAAFVTELETGTVTVDFAEALSAVDLTELTAHIITASIAIQAATGRPAEFVLASTTAFTKAANLIAPSSTQIASPGGMDLRGLAISVGNVPIIHVAGVTAGKFIASNSLAAAWYEDGPFQATEEDVEKLGRNVAYWSLGAGARFIPAGIVEIYDVVP